jgi:4-amino-4-deoxy-L-arabinose transferase-like glycosyltransferase
MKNLDRKYLIIILCILILSTGLLLARANREYLGNFGQRQAYNAWVVRNFVKEGINIFDAKIDRVDYYGKQLSSFRDFPLVIPAVAFCCKTFGGSIEFWGRFGSILFYIGTFIVLFFWLKNYFDEKTLTFILFIFAFFPMSVIYFQSFILEPSALFFFCLGMLCLERYFRGGQNAWLLITGSLLAGISFASRIQYGILIIPFAYMFYKEWDIKALKDKRFYLAVGLALLIPFLWQLAAWNMALAKETKSSLAVTLKTYPLFLDRIFLSREFYEKIFFNFARVIFNPVGFLLVLLGLFTWRWEKKNLLFIAYLFSILLMVILFPSKYFKHDFYFFPIVVPGSVLAGYFVAKIAKSMNIKYAATVILLFFFLASMRFSLHPAFKTPGWQDHFIAQAEVVKSAVPEDGKIAVIGAGATFLYYTDRQGITLPIDVATASRKGSNYVYSEGRKPDDPTGILKHYESLGLRFIVEDKKVDKPAMDADLEKYIQQNYKVVKSNDYITIYKRRT